MAEQKKRRKRVKAASRSSSPRTTSRVTDSSDRYTPPAVPLKRKRRMPWLVPVLMFGFFGAGVAMIILNYLPGAVLLPGDESPWYLLGGLGLICLGFVAATRYQ